MLEISTEVFVVQLIKGLIINLWKAAVPPCACAIGGMVIYLTTVSQCGTLHVPVTPVTRIVVAGESMGRIYAEHYRKALPYFPICCFVSRECSDLKPS